MSERVTDGRARPSAGTGAPARTSVAPLVLFLVPMLMLMLMLLLPLLLLPLMVMPLPLDPVGSRRSLPPRALVHRTEESQPTAPSDLAFRRFLAPPTPLQSHVPMERAQSRCTRLNAEVETERRRGFLCPVHFLRFGAA